MKPLDLGLNMEATTVFEHLYNLAKKHAKTPGKCGVFVKCFMCFDLVV